MQQFSRRTALAALGAVTVFPARSLRAQSLEKVTASWLPIIQTTAFYVALEEKLFEAAGIQVEAVQFQNPNQIIDSLLSGRADFAPPGGAAGITALAEARVPGSFKVFGLQGGSQKPLFINDALLVRSDSEIASFKALKDKKIGTVPGVQWKTIARYCIRRSGLDPDRDVELSEIAVPIQLGSLISGAVDATLSLEPVGSIAVDTHQAKRAVTNPVESFITDPFYSGAAVLSTKFLKERPAVAKKVVDVIDKATKMTNADFGKYRFVLSKYTAVKPDQAKTVAQPRLRGSHQLDATDLHAYQAFVDVFMSEGVLKEKLDVRSLMYHG